MKRFGILLFIFALLLSGGQSFAQEQFSSTLTRLEKSLFGVDFSTQSDSARLKRIEEVVYGQASSSPLSVRVEKLSKDLSADLIGQEIKPKADTFADEDEGYKEEIPKADKNVNYPIVNNMEQKVFSKEFKTDEINQRLAKLEQNVFRKTYSDDLNSRVERLKDAILPERAARSYDSDYDSESGYSNAYTQDDIETLLPKTQEHDDVLFDFPRPGAAAAIPRYNSNNSVLDEYNGGDTDIVVPLAALEKIILKKSYPNEITSNRLTRLELKVFSSTFVDDDEQTRLGRLSSAHQAKKTSAKYDNNKFQQHMGTAMQIGAVLLMILAAIL